MSVLVKDEELDEDEALRAHDAGIVGEMCEDSEESMKEEYMAEHDEQGEEEWQEEESDHDGDDEQGGEEWPAEHDVFASHAEQGEEEWQEEESEHDGDEEHGVEEWQDDSMETTSRVKEESHAASEHGDDEHEIDGDEAVMAMQPTTPPPIAKATRERVPMAPVAKSKGQQWNAQMALATGKGQQWTSEEQQRTWRPANVPTSGAAKARRMRAQSRPLKTAAYQLYKNRMNRVRKEFAANNPGLQLPKELCAGEPCYNPKKIRMADEQEDDDEHHTPRVVMPPPRSGPLQPSVICRAKAVAPRMVPPPSRPVMPTSKMTRTSKIATLPKPRPTSRATSSAELIRHVDDE
jgi:hypothetical protein